MKKSDKEKQEIFDVKAFIDVANLFCDDMIANEKINISYLRMLMTKLKEIMEYNEKIRSLNK